ncbi:MAG: PEP-utilizing enzyme [bacterium]
MSVKKVFPSPFEIETPEGANGWKEMYPYYLLFSEERKELEEERFWFCDTMHWTTPLYPFDIFTAESAISALGRYNTRVWLIPPALGIDIRLLNGFIYLSPLTVDDPEEITERLKDFSQRAGFYYQNWDSLYAKWKEKVTREIEGLKSIAIPDLPEKEDLQKITDAVGISTGFSLLSAYNQLIESMTKIWEYHFEFLNLGYAAFLDFSCFMKGIFPDISDQTITKMVAGIDVILFRPDNELRRLSKLAVELNLSEIFLEGQIPEAIIERLQRTDSGKQWLNSLEEIKDPWFYFNSGTGFYHTPRSWIDDLSIPFSAIAGYIKKLQAGENIERKTEKIVEEGEKLKEGYFSLLRSDEDKKVFLEKFSLAKTVFSYVEEHNFYVEHWHHTIFWNKMREVGKILAKSGFFAQEEDIFYLNRYEISQALYDLYSSWGIGSLPKGPQYWPKIILKRKEIIKALEKWQPVPALGPPPEKITEPFTIMLWGIVSEKIDAWLEAMSGEQKEGALLRGHPASPGVVEGIARIVLSTDDLPDVQEDEIMVCPITTPSWTPVFARIKGVVANVGGMMSHAAIVCREYGLPAVVGTGFGTRLIKTGQYLRVDGTKGIVEIVK